MEGDEEDQVPSDAAPSHDLIAITEQVKKQLLLLKMAERSMARDPDVAAVVELNGDVNLLAEMLKVDWHEAPLRQRCRALRILVRRFGNLGARHMMNLAADVSPLRLRLVLRERTDVERCDGGEERKRIDREWKDARLEAATRRHRSNGIAYEDALLKAAKEVLGSISGGAEGVKKARTRAAARAQERGFVDPTAPLAAVYLGAPVEPQVTVADLPRRGRPRKNRTTPD
jgi:hypothetical protein